MAIVFEQVNQAGLQRGHFSPSRENESVDAGTGGQGRLKENRQKSQ
jgi:hypothetical protein